MNNQLKQRIDFSKLFTNDGRYQKFRKDDVFNKHKWLKRVPGEKDFLTIASASEVAELEKYLSQTHDTYNAEDYNMFTTGKDSKGNPMVALHWCDESMEMVKRAVIVFANMGLAEQGVVAVNEFCLGQDDDASVEAFNRVEDARASVALDQARNDAELDDRSKAAVERLRKQV